MVDMVDMDTYKNHIHQENSIERNVGVRERKKTNLCFVAHETFRNGIHRMEHEQLSNTYNNIEFINESTTSSKTTR